MDKENISVNIRIKPYQQDDCIPDQWKIEGNNIVNLKSKDIFSYDQVFDLETQNIDIFNTIVKENLNRFLKGINVCIFAYGQTSTGKTYTMRGLDYTPGIIPLSLNYIFMKSSEADDIKISEMKVSYLEIYNENVNDLLDTSKKNLEIREGKKGIYVDSLTEIRVDTPEIAFNLVKQGDSNKIMAETKLNEKSSRSHCIFKINLELVDSKGKKFQSTLNLIDLAGSENATKTKTEGVRLKEGSNINKSLLALSNVIQKLSINNKANYISYRDSKLTRFLQPSLSGNSKTVVICTVSIGKSNYSETLNTLLFAARAKNIKTNIKVNELIEEKDKVSIENLELKSKIKLLEDKISLTAKKPSITSSAKKNNLFMSAVKTSNEQNNLYTALEKEVNMIKTLMLSNRKDPIPIINRTFNQPFNLLTAKKEDNFYENIYKSHEKPKKEVDLIYNQGTQSKIGGPATSSLFPESFTSPFINKYAYNNPYSSNTFTKFNHEEFNNNELFEVKKQNKEIKQHFMDVIEKKNNQINSITEASEKIRRDLEENYLKIRLENERIKDELNIKESDLRSIISKLNSSDKQLIFLKEEIKLLKQGKINSNVEIDLSNANDKICNLEKEANYQKEAVESIMIEMKKLREKNQLLTKSNELLSGDNFSLKAQIEMSHKNMDSIKMENIQLRNNIDSYKAEIGLMQTKLVQRKSEINELKLENTKILKKNFNLEYETKIKNLTSCKSSLESELDLKNEVIKRLEDELNTAKSIMLIEKDDNGIANLELKGTKIEIEDDNQMLNKKREREGDSQ